MQYQAVPVEKHLICFYCNIDFFDTIIYNNVTGKTVKAVSLYEN
jgi:hypothetical protein